MKRLHIVFGLAGVLVFLVTGQFMRLHHPAVHQLEAEHRLMFVSRHIYILGAALTNLMLGLYFRRWNAGWPRPVQTIGSLLLLAAPVFLIVAFFLEPELGMHGRSWISKAGLHTFFAGALLHTATFLQKSAQLE